MKANELDRINEFIDKVDELCFEYKIEIVPTVVDGNNLIAIRGDEREICVWYIDGDGRGK